MVRVGFHVMENPVSITRDKLTIYRLVETTAVNVSVSLSIPTSSSREAAHCSLRTHIEGADNSSEDPGASNILISYTGTHQYPTEIFQLKPPTA